MRSIMTCGERGPPPVMVVLVRDRLFVFLSRPT